VHRRAKLAVLGAGVSLTIASGALVGCRGGSTRAARAASTTGTRLGATTTSAVPRPGVDFACAVNAVNQAVNGAYGTASAIGWAGNGQGVVTCLGGWFYAQGRFNQAFGFGIYDGSPTTWSDADGYLPAQMTSFRHGGASVVITEFADQLTLDGHAYVAVYARVAVTNETDGVVVADPRASAGLIPLTTAGPNVPAHGHVDHDYVLAVDNFNTLAPWPSSQMLVGAGGFDEHFQHMRTFWDNQLSQIAAIDVPDARLVDAYRSGFIYTQIARSGDHLNTGVNNYESQFSHDVIGILTNLFTQGYDDNAHALLLDARSVVGQQGQYQDGVWTYAWPWAVYLLKTGDLPFIKANFSAGPPGATGPSLEAAARQIAADRTGPNGIMGRTDDIDSNGYWTVDNFEALTGLAAYTYLAHAVGDSREAAWANAEYESLLGAVNRTLSATIHQFNLSYLPCSMVEPNSANRCNNPEDANWAAPFLFGRWAWDAALLGMPVSGPGANLIDLTYSYGFARLASKLPANTFGGYPNDFYTTAYNAGYGSWGLASTDYRTQGILSYQFMLDWAQSGPYSWWESSTPPSTDSPWRGYHPSEGQGSSPHAWGIANANKVLLDSIAAQEANGTLLVGRGVPDEWVAAGRSISVMNFPTINGGRADIRITGGDQQVALSVSGGASSGRVDFQLPEFVNNIAGATAGTVDRATGTVQLPAGQTSVTVHLTR
jgi:hypothetical protein